MNQLDIVFSFDTTGSMSSVIQSVRDNLTGTIDRLFKEIDGINIGLIAHGDYEDYFKNGQFFWSQEPTNDPDVLKTFILNAPDTNGYDMDECYEYVLYQANQMAWKSPIRLLVVIGDARPHKKGYTLERTILGVPSESIQASSQGEDNETHKLSLCWREEALRLQATGVVIFGCDCSDEQDKSWSWSKKRHMNNLSSNFYTEICRLTNGFHFKFAEASKQSFPHYFVAICMKAKDGAEGIELLREEQAQLQKELQELEGQSEKEPGVVERRERLHREIEEVRLFNNEAPMSVTSFSSEVQASAKKIREKKGMHSRLARYQSEVAADKTTSAFVSDLDRWCTQ